MKCEKELVLRLDSTVEDVDVVVLAVIFAITALSVRQVSYSASYQPSS